MAEILPVPPRLPEHRLPVGLLDRLLTPALVVFLDLVRRNLDLVLARCGGDPDRWRPHVKSAKIPEVMAELAARGIRHFKCATLREARVLLETLAARGVSDPDLLLAGPLAGPALPAAASLAARHPAARLSALAEEPGQAAELPAGLGVFVDVNPGMDRTGLPLADAPEIAAAARAAGPRFRGIHFYEGHLTGPDREERCLRLYGELLGLLDRLARAGLPAAEVVTSGTPAFRHALEFRPFRELRGTVHRVSPGTAVYGDLRSCRDEPGLVPAALVLSRIASHPAPGLVTADAGSKALAAEAGDPCAAVLGRPELVALRPSEEHLPFRVTAGPRPARGEALLLVPRHVCPAVNLAETAVLLDGGEPPAFVPVAARAHDLLAPEGSRWDAGTFRR